LNKENFIHSQN